MPTKLLQTTLKPDTPMLKDNRPLIAAPSSGDLSAKPGSEIESVIAFVDQHIGGFVNYYKANDESDKENWISNLLVRHLQICNKEQGGFLPYDFSKNPPQASSGKETDIGVYVNTRAAKAIPIFEFESKRFGDSSNNKEYVCGERGGIERFKRGHHSSHLNSCGMFGFVQKTTNDDWITKVNDWIKELSTANTDTTIDWTGSDEPLKKVQLIDNVQKLSSLHPRKQAANTIFLWHYFIDLN
jgi:hypothetical protein